MAELNHNDRSFQFGDGLFETMRAEGGQLQDFERHWRRLKKGADRLGFRLPAKRMLAIRCQQFAAQYPQGITVVKLQLSRGESASGYRMSSVDVAKVHLSARAYAFDAALWHEGVNVRVCKQRLAFQPSLAGIKHCNRLEQVLARNEWQDDSIHEGLMLDYQDNVIEATAANIFVKIGQFWYTPKLEGCGIAGTQRERVMEWLALHGKPVIEQALSLQQVESADAILLSNAIIGVWPVRCLAGRPKKLPSELPDLLKKFSSFVLA